LGAGVKAPATTGTSSVPASDARDEPSGLPPGCSFAWTARAPGRALDRLGAAEDPESRAKVGAGVKAPATKRIRSVPASDARDEASELPPGFRFVWTARAPCRGLIWLGAAGDTESRVKVGRGQITGDKANPDGSCKHGRDEASGLPPGCSFVWTARAPCRGLIWLGAAGDPESRVKVGRGQITGDKANPDGSCKHGRDEASGLPPGCSFVWTARAPERELDWRGAAGDPESSGHPSNQRRFQVVPASDCMDDPLGLPPGHSLLLKARALGRALEWLGAAADPGPEVKLGATAKTPTTKRFRNAIRATDGRNQRPERPSGHSFVWPAQPLGRAA
jgi:hypothetical protein